MKNTNLNNTFYKNKKAFTLVELIIVITILAILATIAFIGFQNFAKDSRDGNRIATLTQIEKGLNLVQIQTGKYPLPDGDVLTGALNLGGSELIYSHMGIIDENISRLIKMNTTPLDPVSNSNYIYAVNAKQDKYQIATLLESLEANTKIPLIEKTYANENYRAKVVGNHEINVKIPKDDKIWLTIIPSMIFNPEGGNILNSSGTYHIINGGQNIPYKINDKTITTKETGDKIIQHIRKSQDAKIITVDITDIVKASNETTRKAKIEEIFGTGNTQESKELLASIGAITGSEETINTTILTQTVESIITGGSVGSASSYTAPKKSCDGILDGQTKTFWNIPNVNYGQTCPAGVEFTCNNGNWESQGYNKAEYIHICSVGEASNCEATTIDEYNIQPINHDSIYLAEKIVNITQGTQTYKQTFTCNNGIPEKTGEEEILSPNCNTDYVASGNTCVLGTCTGTPPENSELNGTQGTGTWEWNQTTPGICKYKCMDGYDTSSCTAKTKEVVQATHNSRNYTFTSFTLSYNSPQTKTSQPLSISNGTSTLTAKFTLESDGNTVNLSEQNENIICNTGYSKNGNICSLLPPLNIVRTISRSTSANFSWDVVVGASKYGLYLGDLKLGEVTSASVNITGLNPNTTYLFSISSIDNSLIEGQKSNQISFSTAPGKPTSLTITHLSNSIVSLSWGGVSGVTSYAIYNGVNFLGTTNNTSINIEGLTSNTNYAFNIASYVNSTTISDFTPINFTTYQTTLGGVSGLKVTSKTNQEVSLAWSSLSGATSYNIYRNGNYLGNTTGTAVNITGLTSNTNYIFNIIPKDSNNGFGIVTSINVTTN